MSAPRLPSLRPAGGGPHLLRLVRNASLGLPTTSKAGAIWAARCVFNSARSAGIDCPPPSNRQLRINSRFTSSRSYGASAYAVAEPDLPQTFHVAPRDPPPTHSPSHRKAHTPILHPPEWTEPPLQLQPLLLDPSITPAQFRTAFAEALCEPFHLARVSTLESVWAIWQNHPEMSSWAWLAGQLSHIPSLAGKDELEAGVIPMVQAMNAYAMVQLQHVREARAALVDIRRSRSRGGVYAALIQAAAWVRLEHPDNAKRQITLALHQMVGKAEGMGQAVDMLERLLSSFQRAERWDDLLDIAVAVGGSLRSLVFGMSDTGSGARMAGIWVDILARVPDPAGWLAGRLAGANKDTRWMGAMFLTAIARQGDLDQSGPLLDLITAEGLPLPAGASTKLLSALIVAKHDTAAQVAVHLGADLPSLPHSSLSLLLEYASLSRNALETRRVWSSLAERFSPTPRDKSNFLRICLNTSSPAETETQLRQFFGSADHPKALFLLLSSHITENNVDAARAVFDRLMTASPSLRPLNNMLGLYAANADAESAVKLFDDMPNYGLTPTLHSYTSLISLFANTRDVENARNVFGLMEDSGIAPDAAAYSAVLNAEVEAGEWTAAAQRWDDIPPHYQNHPDVISVILKAYVLLSIPTQRIIDIFRRVARPNAYLWSLAMQAAVDNDDFVLAEQLLAEMDSTKIRPAVYHFSILLHGYMQTGRREEAKATYESMLERHIIPSGVTYGMIMAAFRAVDGWNGLEQGMQFAASINATARQLKYAARGRGTGLENLYGPLVSMAGQAGQLGKAEEYVDLASSEPTVPLYSRLMDAYRQAGQTDSVLAIWDRAFELACATTRKTASNLLGGVATSRIHDNILCIPLSIVLDSLAAAGRYVDVRHVWDSVQRAGFGFDAQNYNHYATALARTGDVDRAFSIVEHVLLPRWEEVKERRVSAMRELGMRESAFGLLPPPPEAPSVDDVPALPTSPSNRRHEVRWGISAINSEYGDRAKAGIDTDLLRHWRPSDVLWRPSLLTLSVLEHAYTQIQDSRRAWLALGGSEEEGEEMGEGGEVTLPSFGHVAVRDVEGEVKKTTPRAVLFRLNRKYVKTVALVMFHRRKRAAKREGT